MGLKSFLQEEKEARKQRKLEKKQKKKSPLTKEEKYYKIAGIITGIIVVFGAIFYSCSSLAGGDMDIDNVMGITNEMVVALKENVDVNLYFDSGKLLPSDLDSCKQKLIDNNANVFDENYKGSITNTFTLTSKEIGALAKELIGSSLGSSELVDLEIFKNGEYYYIACIYTFDLGDIITNKNLSTSYLKLTSKVDVLSGNICILDTKASINMIEEELNDDIIEALSKYPAFSLIQNNNSLVNSTLNLFNSAIKGKINFVENGIEFKK